MSTNKTEEAVLQAALTSHPAKPTDSTAGKDVPKYPVELRCAELEELLGRVAEGLDIEHESYVQVTGGKHREPCKTCDLIVKAREAIWHPSPTSEELATMTETTLHGPIPGLPDEPRGDGLREDVAVEIFYMDSEFCGGKWENEPEDQKNYWRDKADRIIAITSPARTEARWHRWPNEKPPAPGHYIVQTTNTAKRGGNGNGVFWYDGKPRSETPHHARAWDHVIAWTEFPAFDAAALAAHPPQQGET